MGPYRRGDSRSKYKVWWISYVNISRIGQEIRVPVWTAGRPNDEAEYLYRQPNGRKAPTVKTRYRPTFMSHFLQ